MKKYIVILAVAVAGLFSVNASAQSKVAHINSQVLVEAMPDAKTAQTKIQAFADTLDRDFKAMQDELQAQAKDLDAKAGNGTMSPNMIEIKQKQLQDMQRNIQAFQQSASQQIEAKQAQLMKPVIDKAKKAIEDVAKEKGYTYVIDTYQGTLLVTPTGDDILALVKTKLGIK
ncbi:OmpH family outer membrane protein [Chitinophaga horti]|uniref:OmpH family outer membrane protein n=1 Tax=Chitinophaga horti TaxID=2920382 RepID=A0ABY6IYJ1_9BACT|nr:OmpH family outer membrane protein [Chitinophaga horti]UYQ92464.1 OmpH family outer membrane protein [Chitinophaga horti]